MSMEYTRAETSGLPIVTAKSEPSACVCALHCWASSPPRLVTVMTGVVTCPSLHRKQKDNDSPAFAATVLGRVVCSRTEQTHSASVVLKITAWPCPTP